MPTDNWHDFAGVNAGYVLDLYERYRQNPDSVDSATREFFSHWSPPQYSSAVPTTEMPPAKIAGVVNLAHAIRGYGYLAAQLDPLGSPPRGDPSLDPATYGLDEQDLARLPASLVGGPVAEGASSALEAIQALRQVYTSDTGYDFHHIHVPAERDWLRHMAESGRYCPPQDPIDSLALLDRLTQVEAFEQFLHRSFPGKTRFSIEGVDMVVPMLDEIVQAGTAGGIQNLLIGMAHRGRLNVLAHVLGKPYAQILAEFKEPTRAASAREGMGWTGDVRYHAGAQREVEDGIDETRHRRREAVITMPPNPSHVESADPVVEGMARASGTRDDRRGPPQFDRSVSLPILIHGDAAFTGQGIVAETLNMSRLKGYETGGTIHIIANNQLGYTTLPEAARSTLFSSDPAKGYEIPIVHVNADDPIACIEAARLAFGYLAQFHKDFVIDLVGYRRYGHNEGDEPSYTQPLMYDKIAHHPSVRALWAEKLVADGVTSPETPKEMLAKHDGELQRALQELRPEDLVEPIPQLPPPGAAKHVDTRVSAGELRELNQTLLQLPEGFSPNPKLERAMRRRRSALDKPDESTIDWATAEQLAMATILVDGTPIRLTGEDVERGTFGQRHAVLHDLNGSAYVPLQALPQAQAAFEVYDSPLSENAVLGFEYGYNIQAPHRLVIWEAQYGDFVDGAQMIIDEFIVSARAKWGVTPSLTLLLPHGYEGQGPDHSTARLERFLSLAAETNMRIAYPTTAAQYFHLLRRQAKLLETDPLPLVVMAPKSLLRHPRTASTLNDLATGHWQPVIADLRGMKDAKGIYRLILCSGRIYTDLVASELLDVNEGVGIVRVEQLYPFPEDEISSLIEKCAQVEQVIWLQEEPENMGAWTFVEPRLRGILQGRLPLQYVGRPANSSPAEGSMARHTAVQRQLIEAALAPREEEIQAVAQ